MIRRTNKQTNRDYLIIIDTYPPVKLHYLPYIYISVSFLYTFRYGVRTFYLINPPPLHQPYSSLVCMFM